MMSIGPMLQIQRSGDEFRIESRNANSVCITTCHKLRSSG